ncbi:MAG: ABC transporter ATP-binding protein [Oscillospiraceae bacterium]|nr:ABC transporter ATP-binding protein [Oscillospiraceae bacterium]
MIILEARQLTKTYGTDENAVHALNHVSFTVESGSFTAIIGTSGSGKSTLLHMLGGLDTPTSGSVIIKGTDIFSLSEEELTVFRRRNIGFVFQQFNLIPNMTVLENVQLPLHLDDKTADNDYVSEVLSALGLAQQLHKLPTKLSGGQQQRVAIARALVSKPAILLADEPTGNLDTQTTEDVMQLLRLSAERFSQTIVMITHNPDIAAVADVQIRIEDGKILERTAES